MGGLDKRSTLISFSLQGKSLERILPKKNIGSFGTYLEFNARENRKKFLLLLKNNCHVLYFFVNRTFMIELFEFALSGNCYKVRLLLSFLNLQYESQIVNGPEREHKSEAFIAKNPFGQVPVLKDGNIVLRDSHGILVYLARAYGEEHWFPNDPAIAGEIVAWLSTAANEVSRGPSALRAHYLLGRPINLEETKLVTETLLSILEKRLVAHNWLVSDSITIADIAIYPYIALGNQGKIDLSIYPNIRKWMYRIENLPHYLSMQGVQLQVL